MDRQTALTTSASPFPSPRATARLSGHSGTIHDGRSEGEEERTEVRSEVKKNGTREDRGAQAEKKGRGSRKEDNWLFNE